MSLEQILQLKKQGLLKATRPGEAGGARLDAAALRNGDRPRPLTIVIIMKLGPVKRQDPMPLRIHSCEN